MTPCTVVGRWISVTLWFLMILKTFLQLTKNSFFLKNCQFFQLAKCPITAFFRTTFFGWFRCNMAWNLAIFCIKMKTWKFFKPPCFARSIFFYQILSPKLKICKVDGQVFHYHRKLGQLPQFVTFLTPK